MGGCATKPKVLKEDPDGKPNPPHPEPEPEPEPEPRNKLKTVETKVSEPEQEQAAPPEDNLNVNEFVDDDQPNKRRSLSLLFKENEGTKVATENEKTAVGETVKGEVLNAKKLVDDTKSNEPIKQESPKPEEKLSEESKNNEFPKQENDILKIETSRAEKPSEETHIYEPTKETVKPELIAEKPSEETRINEPTKETVKLESEETHITEPAQEKVKPDSEADSEENNQSNKPVEEEFVLAKETPSEETLSNEPIEQASNESSKHEEPIEPLEAGKPSGESEKNSSEIEKAETPIVESINTEVDPISDENVVEVVPTAANSVEKVTKEVASSTEDKSRIGVEDAPKAVGAGSEIH